MLSFLLALACAATIGFAAHRASLCNVRAVAEVMSQGSAHMLGSLLQAAAWATLVSGAWFVLGGHVLAGVRTPPAVGWAVGGGWLFGVGAAINGGCSLSTLHRLADGELSMLATLLGLMLGVTLDLHLAPWVGSARPLTWLQEPTLWQQWPAAAPWMLVVLVLWAVNRALALRKLASKASHLPWRARALRPTYPLVVSAALIGSCAGFLYTSQGAWSYTNHLRTSVLHLWTGSATPPPGHALLVVALVVGMIGSAWQRGSLAWRWPTAPSQAVRHLMGGVLMGAGAALIPGGNDTLLLNTLPTLAIQAVIAYLALLTGIASVLWLMHRAHLPMPAVACGPDGCSELAVQSRGRSGQEASHAP